MLYVVPHVLGLYLQVPDFGLEPLPLPQKLLEKVVFFLIVAKVEALFIFLQLRDNWIVVAVQLSFGGGRQRPIKPVFVPQEPGPLKHLQRIRSRLLRRPRFDSFHEAPIDRPVYLRLPQPRKKVN